MSRPADQLPAPRWDLYRGSTRSYPDEFQTAAGSYQPEDVEWADYAKSVMAGGASLVQSAGWLADVLGADQIGSSVEELGSNAVDFWNDSLSDPAKVELSKEIIRKNDQGEYEWGDPSFSTVGLMGAQSLLGTAAGMGVGAGLTKVLQVFANPFGRAVLTRAATAQAVRPGLAAGGISQAAKKLKLVDTVLGAAGFGAGEGAIGGISAGASVYDNIMGLPIEKMMENDRYRAVYESTDETISELERHQYAADTVAKEASTSAGWEAGLTTALLGAPMGAYFGRILGGAKLSSTLTRGVATGAAGEATQEFAQSGIEQIISNINRQPFEPDLDTFDGALNAAVGGMLAGGLMGGAFGVAGVGPAKAELESERATEENENLRKIGGKLRVAAERAANAGVSRKALSNIVGDVGRQALSADEALAKIEALRNEKQGGEDAVNPTPPPGPPKPPDDDDGRGGGGGGVAIAAEPETDELEPYRVKAREDFETQGVSDRDRTLKVGALKENVSPEASAAYDETYEELVQAAVAERVANPPADMPTEAKPTELELIDPTTLEVDASTFQFKASTDSQGVSSRLKGVKSFDKMKAGVAIVYEDLEGKRYIVDGHQRVGLAKRAIEAGQDPADVQLPSYVLRESDGVTREEATLIAATKNIAEGSGSPIDAAKVLRQIGPEGERELGNLPPTSALVKQAKGLRNLDEDAFAKAVNEVIDPKQAAIVGEMIPENGDLQNAAIEVLRKTQPANATQARSIVDQVRENGTETTKTEDLFGETAIEESLYLERAKVLDAALRSARRDKATFKTLTNRESSITGTGKNKLDREANEAKISDADRALTVLSSAANTKGPISDALTEAAKQVKAGAKPGTVAQGFLQAAVASIQDGSTTGRKPRQAAAAASGQVDESIVTSENLIATKHGLYNVQLDQSGNADERTLAAAAVVTTEQPTADNLFSRKSKKDPLGHCFQNTGRYIMDNDDPNLVLVHGYAVGQGSIDGVRFSHSWIERKNANLLEGGEELAAKDQDLLNRMAMDMTTDERLDDPLEIPAIMYRSIGNVEIIAEYTRDEAMRKMGRSGHFGPWDFEETAEAQERIDSGLYSRSGRIERGLTPTMMEYIEREVVNPLQSGEIRRVDNPGAALLADSVDFRENHLNLPQDPAALAAISKTLTGIAQTVQDDLFANRYGMFHHEISRLQHAHRVLQELALKARQASEQGPVSRETQDDMFGAPAAPEPVAAEPVPQQQGLFSRGKPLSEIKLMREYEVEETGEVVQVEEDAGKLLRQLDKRTGVVEKLRGCVRG